MRTSNAPPATASAGGPGSPEAAYCGLAEQAPVGMAILSQGRIIHANPALARLFGCELADLCPAAASTESGASPAHDHVVRQLLPQQRDPLPADRDVTCHRCDDSPFPARIRVQRDDLTGAPINLVSVADLSETTGALHTAERRSRLLAQTEVLALSGACEYDVASGSVRQSAGMFRLFGEPCGDRALDGEWLMARLPRGEVDYVRAVLEGVRPGLPLEFEHRIVRRDGVVRTVLHRTMAEADAHGRTGRVVSILQDITARRAAEQQRDRLAETDSVTGLKNRDSLLAELEISMGLARRTGQPLALLLVQVDQMKLLGDSLSLAGGDHLLASIGQRLAGLAAPADTMAHLGNGQYAWLPDRREGCGEALARALAQTVLDSFKAPHLIDAMEISTSASVGLSLFQHDGDSPDQLLQRAQAAVLRRQGSGVCRVGVYAADVQAQAARRLAIEAGLRRALGQGEFTLLYQPQLDLATGMVVGVEALLRWTDSQGTPIPPAEFMPVAEESGLSVHIGEWVLRRACEQNAAWQHAGLPSLRMAVKLSVHQLQQPDVGRRIAGILAQAGLDPRLLGVEIAENVLMNESAQVTDVLRELRGMGVEISIDDFGTGYSNLSYLSRLPIDVVKIDRSFVHDIAAPEQDVSMTRAVIRMAHSMQMRVLAEGVETEGQLSLLMAHHCDGLQGPCFSPPVTASDMAQMLRSGRCLPARLLRPGARRPTLLLVDDDEMLLMMLRHLLKDQGYRIVSARSGNEALQRIRESGIDVIVSDQRMPGMTGVEFLRRARDICPEAIRIVLSGDADLPTVSSAVNEGAIYRFLTKPWVEETLLSHVSEAFQAKARQDRARREEKEVLISNQQLRVANEQLQRLVCQQCATHDATSLPAPAGTAPRKACACAGA